MVVQVRRFVVFLILACVFIVTVQAAPIVLEAASLAEGVLTEARITEPFALMAKPGKNVTVEKLAVPRELPNGEKATARIKLNGGGNAEARSIQIKAQAVGEITVYTNSSSKTDARILKLINEAGEVIAQLPSPADNNTAVGVLKFPIPKAGTYYLFSASGGINLYKLELN